MVEFPCQYEEQGCTVKLLKRDLAKHQETCPAKPVQTFWQSYCLIM